MGVIKFSLNATRSVLLQFWWEYLLLVGFKDGEYYILKSPYFKDILQENKCVNAAVTLKLYIKGIAYRGSF